jgi:TonB family protein
MRKVLAATILALPMFASAQAVHTGISHLVASVDAPAFAFQTAAVNAVAPRVFSGLIAPIRVTALTLAPSKFDSVPANAAVTVEFTVDTAGIPQNVQVVGGTDAATSERVVAAVRNVRYTPGKLNGQPAAFPITMLVNVTN